jgi:hypothetical protein
MLADAQVVMEPKTEKDDLQALYRPYLLSNFDLVSETEHWKVHRRSPSAPRTISSEAGRP